MNAMRHSARVAPLGLALSLTAACWLLVRGLLSNGPGLFEARFISTHAAVALALFAVALTLDTPARLSNAFLTLLPLPFLAVIALPTATQPFAASLLIVPAAVASVMLWRECTSEQGNWASDVATVSVTIGIGTLLHPLDIVTGTGAERLELIAVLVAIGVGTAWLRRQWGLHALLAAAAALVLTGAGWFAGLALLATAAMASAAHSSGRQRALFLGCAVVALTAACWMSWAGLFLPMAAWARTARRGWLASIVVIGALLALSVPSRPWGSVGVNVALLVLLFPFAVAIMLADERSINWRRLRLDSDRLWRLLTGVTLAAVGLRTLDPSLALVPAALHWCAPFQPCEHDDADVHVVDPEPSEVDPVNVTADQPASTHLPVNQQPGWTTLSAAWLGAWLLALSLGASYPWLRPEGLITQLEVNRGTAPAAAAILLAAASALLVGLIAVRLAAHSTTTQRVSSIVAFGAVLPLSLASVLWGVTRQPTTTVHTWPPQVLTSAAPSIEIPVPGEVPTAAMDLWLDSFLANAASVPAGTTVARIELLGSNRPVVATLRAGEHTAEWSTAAATRPAPEGTLPAFTHWWSEETPARLGRRYRARLPLQLIAVAAHQPRSSTTGPAADSTARLHIELDPGLISSVQLRIDRIALQARQH